MLAACRRAFSGSDTILVSGGSSMGTRDLTVQVLGALPNDQFSVEVRDGRKIVAHVTGKMRMNFSRILPGDRVTVEPSPYDRTRGRIVAKA